MLIYPESIYNRICPGFLCGKECVPITAYWDSLSVYSWMYKCICVSSSTLVLPVDQSKGILFWSKPSSLVNMFYAK